MAKITLIEKTHAIRWIILGSEEKCSIDNCGHDNACHGKNIRRDNGFICDLRELMILYRRSGKK